MCDQGGRRKTGRRHITAVRTDGGVRGTGAWRTQTAGWTLPYWAAKEEEEAARKVGKGAEGDAAAGAVRRERSKRSAEFARKSGRADVQSGERKKEVSGGQGECCDGAATLEKGRRAYADEGSQGKEAA